jgi:arginyl-tRNA synthetase
MALIDEAKDTAKKQLVQWQDESAEENARGNLSEEEIEKISEVLGLGAIKYFDLKQNRIQDYKFDIQAMT